LGISFIGIFASGLRAGAPGEIAPIAAVTMYDIWSKLTGQLFSIFIAIFIGAMAIISLRTSMFPSWFGWASALIAFELLTPFAYNFLAFGVLWLLVVSIWIYVRGAPAVEPSTVVEPV